MSEELGSDRPGAEASALAALGDAEADRDALAAGVDRLEGRYVREDDLDSPKAEALLSMIERQRTELSRAQQAITRAADELAAVRLHHGVPPLRWTRVD